MRGYSFYGVDIFHRNFLGRVREKRLFLSYDLYLNMFSTQKVVKSTQVHVGLRKNEYYRFQIN